MNPEQQQQQQQHHHQWTTPTNASMAASMMTTPTAQSVMDHHKYDNHNNHNNNSSTTSNTSSSMHTHNMGVRQLQRVNQIDDEMEHVQMFHESQRELLHDTLQNLRQRIHDIEQDHWKYDIVR